MIVKDVYDKNYPVEKEAKHIPKSYMKYLVNLKQGDPAAEDRREGDQVQIPRPQRLD